MVKVVQIPAGGWEILDAPSRQLLLGPSPVYAVSPGEGFDDLRAAGVVIQPVPGEGVAGDGVIVLPPPFMGPLYELVAVVDRLLGPGGCPWDQAQTHESLKRYLLEEAYEVLDAIDSGSEEQFKEELGDLLLQPVLHAQMKRLAGSFDTDAVARGITKKLIRRHPHVFGEVKVEDVDQVLKNWDRIKSEEKGEGKPASRLAGVPVGMASLLRAYEVSKRAVRAGFEWPDLQSVFDKLHEEEAELRDALEHGDQEHVEAELGDLLFTAVNIARWCKVEPEEALRKMLNRFTVRFQAMERLAEVPLEELSLEQWDALWIRSKAENP